jgi:ATP-binding cassette subfamily B (MDR/TAP) protein 1
MIAGERQSKRCREEYLRSILRQEIEWFDLQNQAELPTRFSLDVAAYQLAIGEKVSTVIMTASMFFTGFGIAMAHGWILSLVILASLPVIVISWYLFITTSTSQNERE